mmetsp:Transcript_7203/g.20455  ORF Transcript_7203/g.20455 Transcript_7203/m.20455 type:complete len:529 (-) Transcript_7203:18-1604(-)
MPTLTDPIVSPLAGVSLSAFGAKARFVVLEEVPPPSGFEGAWCFLREGAKVAEEPWADERELATTSALIILMSAPSEACMALLRSLATHFREHPLESPPVLLVPMGPAASLPEMQPWLDKMLGEFVVDEIITGAPTGFALAFAVQAKLQSLAQKLDRLQEDLELRAMQADQKEHILATLEFARWQYLRARLFHAIPPTRSDVEDSEAQTVGGYRLGHKVSRGAFGMVKVAKRGELAAAQNAPLVGMLTVDKHESVRGLNDMKTINSFLNTMERLRRNQHPNISCLVEVFSSPTHLYVAMELSGPRTLFSRLCLRDFPGNGGTRLPILSSGLQSLMSQICAGVCHLHLVADVCHRDIKPENISVREHASGHVDAKLFGFELAAVQPGGQTCRRICGTMPFTAPEMLLAGREGYDGKAADMWSLGVLLAEIACGLRAFERALPEIGPSCAKPSKTAGTPHRRSAPPAKIAKQVQDALRGPEFVSRLLDGAVPEASALTWLKPVVTGLLTVDHTQRLDAAELEPRVPKGGR